MLIDPIESMIYFIEIMHKIAVISDKTYRMQIIV